MKNFYKNTITFFTSLTRPHPLRDWYIILSISGMLFVVLLSVALYFFIGLQSGAIIVPKDGGGITSPNVSREDLRSAIDAYDERRLNFESDNIGVPDVSNPAN